MGLIQPKQVIADSSFYICFLEDIKQPQKLVRILKCFTFIITPIVHGEVRLCQDFQYVESMCPIAKHSPVGEILKPFFSKKQVEKGETEVIELAYECYAEGTPIRFILDDGQARGFAETATCLNQFVAVRVMVYFELFGMEPKLDWIAVCCYR